MGKKIIIISHSLEVGGAERSLIGLLSSLNPKKVEIDLFLLRHEGELYSQIPPYVNIIPEVPAYTVLARPMKKTFKEGHYLLTSARLLGKIMAWLYDKRKRYSDSSVALEYSHKYTWRLMPEIMPEKEYDMAISFLTPHYIGVHKVRAKKRIAWIHTDYSSVQVNVESELTMWDASHLYQYVIEYGQNNPSFVNACRNIYWKYYRQLVHCSIYTWKEKALYSLFMMGFKTYEEK